MLHNRRSLINLFLLAIVCLLAGLIAHFIISMKIPAPTPTPTPNEVVVETASQSTTTDATTRLYTSAENSAFAKAKAAEDTANFDEALHLYEEALDSATTPAEEAHIYYRMARVAERTDVYEAISIFKEIIDNDEYPKIQKSYAAMWLPLIISRSSDLAVKNAVLSGEPYASLADDDMFTLYKNLYEYSLSFGSNGLGEFTVARWEAKQLAEGGWSTDAENTAAKARIDELFIAGEEYIAANISDPTNSPLLPRIYRERARANGVVARLADPKALSLFDQYFLEAIEANILSKLDGAVRFDYFLAGYLAEGEASFAKTQKHLDTLIANIHEYPGMAAYFKAERNNFYGSKDLFVEMANKNSVFKQHLIDAAGWTLEDFTS